MDYFALRACERLAMSPAAFERLPASEQCRLIAYDDLRRREDTLNAEVLLSGRG